MDGSDRSQVIEEELARQLSAAGVRPSHLRSARRLAHFRNIGLAESLRKMGLATSEQLARALAAASGLEYVGFAELMANDYGSVAQMEVADPFKGLPIRMGGDRLRIVVADANAEIDSSFMAYRLERSIASTRALRHAYRRIFARTEHIYREIAHESAEGRTDDHTLYPRMLVALLRHACYAGASDMQIHRVDDMGIVRLVVDGVGQTFDVLDADVTQALYNVTLRSTGRNEDQLHRHIFGEASFVEAGLSDEVVRRDFEELRTEYDFRVNFGRAKAGLTLTVRFLARDAETQEFEQLGFEPADRVVIQRALTSSSGLIVVTGPTGSSKTTTRYAMLSRIDPEERSIQTIENPVEYTHPMWMQYELRGGEEEDLGTEKVFRGMLRNAPRVVDVAEVRSPGTVATMMRAAATGHLVFTTLHADDAALAIYMLRTLGVSDRDLTTNLQIVIGVRLVRRLCPSCRRSEHRAEVIEEARALAEEAGDDVIAVETLFAASEGCPHCTNGYRGRFLLYELLQVQGQAAELIKAGADVREIRRAAIEPAASLRGRAWRALREGFTTVDELRRVLPRRRD